MNHDNEAFIPNKVLQRFEVWMPLMPDENSTSSDMKCSMQRGVEGKDPPGKVLDGLGRQNNIWIESTFAPLPRLEDLC